MKLINVKNNNYSSKPFSLRDKMVEDLHLSNNTEYKSAFSNKNIDNNNSIKRYYSTNEINNFPNSKRNIIDLISTKKRLINSKIKLIKME